MPRLFHVPPKSGTWLELQVAAVEPVGFVSVALRAVPTVSITHVTEPTVAGTVS
jgi:hypothetical protein